MTERSPQRTPEKGLPKARTSPHSDKAFGTKAGAEELGAQTKAARLLKDAGFQVASPTRKSVESEPLPPTLDLRKYKGRLDKVGSEFREAVSDELSKVGIDPALGDDLYEVFIAFEAEISTPAVPDRLRKKMPRLFAQIAAKARSTVAAEGTRPRWADREVERYPTAEAFLREVYAGRLGIEGDLTQAELGKSDPRLLAALDAEFAGERRADLHALLPTTKQRRDAQLLNEYGYVPEGADRRKKLTVLARKGPRPFYIERFTVTPDRRSRAYEHHTVSIWPAKRWPHRRPSFVSDPEKFGLQRHPRCRVSEGLR